MRSFLIFLSFYISVKSFAQNHLSYNSVDSASYIQFVNRDYKNLWVTGKKALKNDIDFYYLRTRLGISYFENDNYESAVVHFTKAHEMNPTDSLIKEYLYLSLVYTNRLEDATDLAVTFTETFKKRIGFKNQNVNDLASSFKSISITGGGIFKIPIPEYKESEEFIYCNKTIQNNASLVNLYLENRASNRLSFFNSLSYFNVESTGRIEAQGSSPLIINYSNPNYQYTLGAVYVAKKDLSFSSSFGYFKENSQFITSNFTAPNIPFTISTYSSNINAYTSVVGIFKRHHNVGFGLAQSIGNLSSVNQFQTEGTFLWYPRGNTTLYTNTSFAWLNNDANNQYIFTQKFGGKASKNIWYELKGSYGNHQNYIANGGIVAYNTIEPIKLTGEVNLSFFIKSFKISPSYSIQQRESSYFKFITPTTSETITKNYINQLIKCTFQFNF
jgi:hypothetical protein